MRMFLFALLFVVGVPAARTALASDLDADAFTRAVEGTYILFQNDGSQRALSFFRGRNVVQVSGQEKFFGYTSGLGSWMRTGAHHIKARVIDFEFDRNEDTPTGVALVDFDITLSEEVGTQYQALSGTFSVRSYAAGQDPQRPTELPIRTFSDSFTGSRVAVPETP